MPKISVIVPVYNVEKYLARCVGSILAQTFKDYELILVDDGSPDNCPKICDEYAAKYDFVHVIHKRNGGLSDAKNYGIEYALKTDSEWITFIDSDDYVHPQFLEILYNIAVRSKTEISCCGFIRKDNFDFIEINCDNYFDKVVVKSADDLSNSSQDYFNCGVTWGRLYKKEKFQALRFPLGKYYEDGFTIYKVLFSVEKIAVVDLKLYCWYINPESITNLKPSTAKTNDYIDEMLEQIEFYKANGFNKSYFHEIENFLLRMRNHVALYGDDKQLKTVTKRFKKEAKKLIKREKSYFNYSIFDESYKIVFSPIYILFQKVVAKLKTKT